MGGLRVACEAEPELYFGEVKWASDTELTAEQKDRMRSLVTNFTGHFAFGMHDWE